MENGFVFEYEENDFSTLCRDFSANEIITRGE